MDFPTLIQSGLLLVALVAAIVSIIELRNYKVKENNKLLSQLNKRYIENKDVQYVVKYLRQIDPSVCEPSAYQVELFLRFFEELGIYLKTNSIKKADVNEFFDFYFYRYETTDRGKILKAKINNEDTNEALRYLGEYRKQMNNYKKSK